MKYITDNETAESTVQTTSNTRDGKGAFKALMKLYEGFGSHGVDITKADLILQNPYYHGEKIYTCGGRSLKNSLLGRLVYLTSMRNEWCFQMNKDYGQTKSSIDVELSKVPVLYQYNQALQCFKSKMNKEFPPMLINFPSGYRRVNSYQSSH